MKKAMKIILIILFSLVLLLIAVVLLIRKPLAMSIYNDNFGKRFASDDLTSWEIGDFNGLQREGHTFSSDKGQLLTGYRYFREEVEPRGVVVIAHGFGCGGHRNYMHVANYFASNGYVVFAYDATGNDESEGDVVGGLPQGLIDLDYALRFVKSEADFAGLPIMLWGHSWGGYSVGSVLALHPDVKAAVVVAGFNASLDMLESEGRKIAGSAANLALSLLADHEAELFGDYAAMSVLEGVAATDARVMFIHSADDDLIPIEISFDRFQQAFGDSERCVFIRYEDRGHGYLYCDPARQAYVDAYNAAYAAYTAANGPLEGDARTAYYDEHLDMSQLYPLDMELMAQMLALYDSALE